MLPDRCLHEIFAERVAEAPHRIALVAGDESLTYAELEARAGRLAGLLRECGVGPETLVGLCCPRDASLIVGVLGILKAGGAYLPIDPAYPDERVRLLLEENGVTLVVGTAEVLDRVGVDAVDPAAGDADLAPLPRTPGDPGSLAYVISTSGSTGRPKGVEIEHRNVVRLFTTTDPWFGFGPDDVWTMFHAASFDFSVWEIWGPLLHGGRLVLVPAALSLDPAAFRALLARERVTVLSQTPSAFRQLLADAPGEAGPALRVVVFGGERLDVTMLRPWLERPGDRPRLINMYGITETTVHTTYHHVRAADLRRPAASPIGVALPDLRLTLHDETGAEVPDGTPGELWVSGAGVARGYRGRPELTAERFVTGPGGRRAYRSGDAAVRDERGDLVYLGRIDEQIKVRGYRIEPAEIEVSLTGHPAVTTAVVTGEDFGGGDVRLVAYIQPAAGPAADPAGDPAGAAPEELLDVLRRHSAARLPAHLRPAEYRPVARIPLTSNGKVDRKALADANHGKETEMSAADAEEQEGVAAIVTDVLRRSSIAPEQDVFDVGATSLAFIRIIAQVNDRFGVSLNGSELGDSASVASLSTAVHRARQAA